MFCIQEGKTVEESDATVFFNQSQLFAHLARHPRPLPVIPGLTVVEAPEIPPAFRDNFDLHLPHPPMLSVMVGLSRELSRLPSAIATETRKIQNGVMRSPPGRDPVLHFAIGARIIGIEFPVKYEGKWGIGWHDGVRAAFEADSVQIDAPPKTEIKMQGTSNVQAVARWKWNQKNGDDRWLKFDKGDVIKNIGCKFLSICSYYGGGRATSSSFAAYPSCRNQKLTHYFHQGLTPITGAGPAQRQRAGESSHSPTSTQVRSGQFSPETLLASTAGRRNRDSNFLFEKTRTVNLGLSAQSLLLARLRPSLAERAFTSARLSI